MKAHTMKAYTMEELIELVTSKNLTTDRRTYERLRDWLQGFPPKTRPAAALALSVAKWSRDNPTRGEGGRRTCGCCVYYLEPTAIGARDEVDCGDCPLRDQFELDYTEGVRCIAPDGDPVFNPVSSGAGQRGADRTYNAILKKYREAYAKLPREWREG